MAKTAVLVGIISMIMMQSVSGAPEINYNQDHVENATKGGIKQGYIKSKLTVGGRASNLADRDWGAAGQSDPYMEVVATDVNGYTEKKTSSVKGGTNNPSWQHNELVFSERTWKKMTVTIWDDDGGREPDQLCPPKEVDLDAGSYVIYDCNPGTATINYSFQVSKWPPH